MSSNESSTRRLGKLDLAATLPHTGDEQDELPFGQTIGRYIVLGVLGRGGMGIVYEAYDPVLDRRIAVKLLREIVDDDASAGRARMQREAQALARLSHPNVITVHDVNEHDGAMYIAMELVRGTTLHRWQMRRGWREIVGAYSAAARGLAAAHAAGLVHRDFKPDNVLVGDDGRVRVTDFGLARLAAHAPPTAPSGHASPSLEGNLTAAGTVMGTPLYMAPEQIDGGAVDARSDQCSWCIALWEAIYGEQPFATGSLAVRSAAMKSDAPKPSAAGRVPRAVARVLQRGLAPEPARRWPSMAALLGALDRATSSRRIAIALGASLIGGLAIAVLATGRAGDEPPRCAAAGAAVDDVWTPAIERDLSRGFAATGAPFAGDAVAALGRSVAAWRTRWQRLAVDSCEATRHGAQTAATLDLRAACLLRARDRLRTQLAALGENSDERSEIAGGGAGVLPRGIDRKAVEAAASAALPDLDACSDVAALTGTVPPPRDPSARLAIEAQLDALERAAKALSIDHAKRLIPDVERQIAAAVALGWPPLTARARRDLQSLQFQLGNGKAARATLLAAAGDASAAGDLDALVEIYLDLIEVEVRLTSEFALGEGWNQLAAGTLARLGPRPHKQLAVARSRGLIAQRAGRFREARDAYAAALALARALGPRDELRLLIDLGLVDSELGELTAARDHLDRALALARSELGDKHPRISQIQHDLGTVVYRQGRYAESEQLFRTALDGRAAAYGTDSTDYALTIEAIGNAEIMQDKVADARGHFEEAIRIFEARLGPEHPDVANAYNDVGGAYHRAGLYQLALDNARHVLALREKALGPDHPDVAQSLVNMAIEAKNLEQWDVVDPSYRRALAIFGKAYGVEAFEVGVAYLNLGEAKRVHGELDAAGDAYEHARRILAAKLGEDHPLLAHVWNGIGQLDLARGRLDAARPLLERAVAMREHDKTDATDLAESRFALARAIAATDRPRAVQLATQARDVYRTAGPGYAKRLAAIEAWLARRG